MSSSKDLKELFAFSWNLSVVMRRKIFFRYFLNSWDLIFLGIFTFLTRFFNLSFPKRVVFDEAHFGLYATKYFSHQYYFDIHPPLGKMLLALAGFFGKIKPGFNFEINSFYGDFNFLALRFLPALFGSLLVLLIYFFVKEMGFSRRVSFLSGFMILFDNAFLVQSRLILLDIILVFLIFLSLYLFILSRKFSPLSFKWYLCNIFLSLALGGAISIKWTGFGALAIVWFFIIFEDRLFSKPKKEILARLGLIFIAPFLIYFLIFAIHFYLLPLSCKADCGTVLEHYLHPDKYFLKSPTNALLYGNSPPGGNLLNKFLKANRLMLGSNLGTGTTFYYQSDWWSWPLMARPIQYFQESQNGKTSVIYFIGNPIIWWLGIVGILGYFYLIIKNFLFKFRLKMPQILYSGSLLILISGYLAYMIPFSTIPRFMLMYHYLPALLFSIIIFSILFEIIIEMLFGPSPKEKFFFTSAKANFLFIVLLIIILSGFLYFLPLTYGFPVTDGEYNARMWLDTWAL